ANCDETRTGPLGPPAEPLTTTFQVLSSAPPLAFIGMTASVCPSGIDTPPDEPTPGGFHGKLTAIGALKPSLRWATTFRFIVPPRTIGTFGSTTSMENGASSVTATASLSTVRAQNGMLFWPRTSSEVWPNSEGIGTLGSTCFPVTRARVAATGASAAAVNRTGKVPTLAAIVSACTATPEGNPSAPMV